MTDDSGDLISENISSIGWGEFLEDIFGFNLRSFKSIWALFKNPADYFRAARSPHWLDKYTPSLRIILGLTAISIALQFLWTRPNSQVLEAMHTSLRNGFEIGAGAGGKPIDLSQVDLRENLITMLEFSSKIQTPIFIILMGLLAWAYRAWGEKLPYIVRLRYLFALWIPPFIVSVIWGSVAMFFSENIFNGLSFLQIPVTIFVLVITAMQGPFGHMEKAEAFGRAVVLSISMYFFVIAAQLIAIVYSMQKYVSPEIQAVIKAAAAQ